MKKITVIDEIQLKQEFREMYKDIGEYEMWSVLYQLLYSSQILCEVLKEEHEKSKNA